MKEKKKKKKKVRSPTAFAQLRVPFDATPKVAATVVSEMLPT